ncbi:hypothetical protein ACNYC7_10120 [Morganella morganii]|uniref:hypothetical protein n=1 Tax=Morganella morganii TaxID=582 RepID=UPI0021A55FF1|nr:hypothetical protein [Morganella morganii]EKT0593647.1 hypothetical protein [Morganella morganii]MBS5194963.1 hypothetical protein [Morganella morganii]
MFQFKNLIQTGMGAASYVEQNRKSIDDVFSNLNKELTEETDGLFTIVRYLHSTRDILALGRRIAEELAPKLSVDTKPQTGTLNIVLGNGDNASVAFWEQHSDGYPFTIEFLGERTDCWDQEALIHELGKLVSSGQLWLKVKELQSQAAKKQEHDNNTQDK